MYADGRDFFEVMTEVVRAFARVAADPGWWFAGVATGAVQDEPRQISGLSPRVRGNLLQLK